MTRHPHDDLAAYAAGALEPGEAGMVERHLGDCPACRSTLDDYRGTFAALIPDAPAPTHVWDRIVAGAGLSTDASSGPSSASPVDIPPAGAGSPVDGHVRRERRPDHRYGRRSVVALAAAAAVVVLALGVAIGHVTTTDPADPPDAVDAVLRDPDHVTTRLVDSDGLAVGRVVAADAAAYVLLDELAELPSDQTYQLWHLTDEDAVSLGVLGDGTVEAVPLPRPPQGVDVDLAVTREPAPGVVTATGPVVAEGTLPAA